jgi:hypothetical protein
MLKTLVLSSFILATNVWAANFELVSEDKSPEAIKLLKAVEKVFPQPMKEVIGSKINVKFTDLNGSKIEKLNSECDQKLVLGKVVNFIPGQSGTIQLDRVLLQGIESPKSINCSHRDTFTYATAVAVHELSHLYDNKKKISSEAGFLNLSGWISKGIVIKKRTNLNNSKERSPDAYEYKNPGETFAVNFEFFLLDKNFKCRRPSYFNFYSKLLGMEPFGSTPCEMNKKITLMTQSVEKKPTLTRVIDPARIYQIHYLFAGKGKEMMSRWGHAMFRLVICAPGKPVGPSCLQDFSHHVVVSYRANVEDMTMSYKKGMDGSYASQLFLMNINDVVNEYTKGEFRDVISLPLKLSTEQIALFTNKLLENYWSYKGSYFFLTNNCATEALNLLRAAYPHDNVMQTKNVTTPLGLYDLLIKSNLVNSEVLNNTKEAIYFGHLFPGVSDKLLASLKIFDAKMEFQKFALELNAAQRLVIYQKTLEKGEVKRMNILANALRLEDQILLAREQVFSKKIGNALFGKNASEDLKNTVLDDRIMEIREEFKKLSAENYIDLGYGIPLKNEFHDISESVVSEIMEKIQASSAELKEIAAEYFPEEVGEMQKTLENRFFILTEIAKPQ